MGKVNPHACLGWIQLESRRMDAPADTAEGPARKANPPDHSLAGPPWWWLLLALAIGRLFHDHLAQQLELAHLHIQVLKRQAAEGSKRPKPTERERRRMGELAKALGRKVLMDMRDSLIVTPDTLMRWYRKFCTAKYDSCRQRRKAGRPRTQDEVRNLVIQLAKENIHAGYTRIHDIMRGLNIEVSRSTVVNILKEAGIPTAPNRGMSWSQFLRTTWESLAAVDFFTVDTPTACHYVFFAIRHHTREILIAGITEHPTAEWVANRTRWLTDPIDGFLRDCTHVIHDRDPAFVYGMDPVLRATKIKPVVNPPRSPNLNAYAERWVKSVRNELLDNVPIFCERQLRYVLEEYAAWYNHERPHQGLDGAYIDRLDEVGQGEVLRTSRLTGLLNHYSRAA